MGQNIGLKSDPARAMLFNMIKESLFLFLVNDASVDKIKVT